MKKPKLNAQKMKIRFYETKEITIRYLTPSIKNNLIL
jgi:hypothetical protein